MNKILSIVILFVILSSCSSSLKIYKATAQCWCVADKNIKGVNYHILLPVKANYNQLTLDSLLILSEKINQFNYSVIGKSNTFQQFQKNDTIIISYNVSNLENIEPVIIYYTYKNKTHRLSVDNFIELHKLCP